MDMLRGGGLGPFTPEEVAAVRAWTESRRGKPSSLGMVVAVRLLATADARALAEVALGAATDHLLHDHDCDATYWEQFQHAWESVGRPTYADLAGAVQRGPVSAVEAGGELHLAALGVVEALDALKGQTVWVDDDGQGTVQGVRAAHEGLRAVLAARSRSGADRSPATLRARADAALAEMGLRLREWQPIRCALPGCPFPAHAHTGWAGDDLYPPHAWEPVADGPVRLVLESLAAPSGGWEASGG